MYNPSLTLTLDQALQLGIDLFRADRTAEAEDLFQHILARHPAQTVALDMMGCIAHRNGRHDRALDFFRRALQADPNDPFVHFNLGVALEEQGRTGEAAASYHRVLVLKTDHLKALHRLAHLLRADGDNTRAVDLYCRALNLQADNPVIHHDLGMALRALGRSDDALDCLRKAVELSPDYGQALNNLADILRERGQSAEALPYYQRALNLDSGNAKIYSSLGAALESLGRYAEALASFRKAYELAPNIAAIRWNLALILLLHGELAEGLACYEYRFDGAEDFGKVSEDDAFKKLAAKPRWQGEDLQGRKLLVWTEQGLGDSLMMMRYLPRLKDKGAGAILVACQPALARAIQTMPAISRVIAHGDPFSMEEVDLHCPMMSLAHLFGTRLETIPNTVPYLHVPPAMAKKWQSRLSTITKKKVGLVWAGSQTQRKDPLRSVPFQCFAPLLAMSGVCFISLQKEKAVAEPALVDWMVECKDLLDTASLVQQLDLVISVDTAVAHLAGALGRPVWLLNRYESEWRWMLTREDSPWYPTMRIFRQPSPHDWGSVIVRVVTALQEFLITEGKRSKDHEAEGNS